VASALGPGFTLVEGHPGGGTYDVLWIRPVGDLETGQGLDVRLNRNGQITVQTSRGDLVPLLDSDVWRDLAMGRRGVSETGQLILASLQVAEQRRNGRVEVLAWRVLAAVLAQAALYGVDWSVQHAAIDSSGWVDDEVERGLLGAYEHQLHEPSATMSRPEARRYWLVTSGDTQSPASMFKVGCFARTRTTRNRSRSLRTRTTCRLATPSPRHW
jgi:hypothetical protein